MVDGIVCDHAKSCETDPFPVDDVLVHRRRLELDLLPQVEYLECALVGLERDDLPLPVHDGAVGLDRPSCDLIIVLQINDDNLRVGIFGQLLANADIVIGLKGLVRGLVV